jgi:N-ethylmaleimide reductase
MSPNLFDNFELSGRVMQTRIAMAPMTRNRADANGDPNELMATYYAQRSSFSLIVTEGTAPEQIGKAYPHIPGIFADSHESRWKEVVDRVRKSASHPPIFFMQLMHSGRISHPAVIEAHKELLPSSIKDSTPQGPSAIRPEGEIFNGSGNVPFEIPVAMSNGDFERAINSFKAGAIRAVDAGFHGVEVHAANGYLLHQFLSENSNRRSDGYGGSINNRLRFTIEVIDAVSEAIGPERVAIRISPGGTFNDIHESEIQETYSALIDALNTRKLSYLHLANQIGFDAIDLCRDRWKGVLIVNSGYGDKDKITTAKSLIEKNRADIFSFGRLALANPNLPKALASGITDTTTLNKPDSKTFYGGGESGYTDYPEI